MRENKYDDPDFFERYRAMPRSEKGLAAAGEWPRLRAMLPDLRGKRVLDLGCGMGWHCRYAAEKGAASVLGIDLSRRMLAEAERLTDDPRVRYLECAVEDVDLPAASFDVALSSLALHYVESFREAAGRVRELLAPGGDFVFSVEHPVFTAQGRQDWFRDGGGAPLHWPVDRYFDEGRRVASFLGRDVVKRHRTIASYLGGLLEAGFAITGVAEPIPEPEMLAAHPEMAEELRRPMMMLVSAKRS